MTTQPDETLPLDRITVVIPARKASTRLVDKVLADIHGKPMVVRVAERVQQSGISRIVVATDHPEVVEVCHQHHLAAVITKEAHTGTGRVALALQQLSCPNHDFVINVQGDEPLLNPCIIHAVAQAIVKHPQPCATPIGRIVDGADMANPNIVKCVFNHQQEALYFSRAPIPWQRGRFPDNWQCTENDYGWRHYGVYAFKVAFLNQFARLPISGLETAESLEQLRILEAGYKIRVVPVDVAPSPAVDTLEDLQKVRSLWAQ